MMETTRPDWVLVTEGFILTMNPSAHDGKLRDLEIDASGLESLGSILGGCVAVAGDRISYVGDIAGFESVHGPLSDHVVDHVGDRLVMPGLVDCHTHMAFAGSRQKEFLLRLRGASYMEIHRNGGGIGATTRAVRESSQGELAEAILRRLDRHLENGVTTCEIKSGYGLSTEHELMLLRAIESAGKCHPVDVVSSFMGAHSIAPEFKDDPKGYIDLLTSEMIPEVARLGLAEFCDVFCEKGVFDPRQSLRILMAAKGCGLGLKIHADEIVSYGGAELAAEVGAISAEHLLAASDRGLKMMASAGVTAALLPTTPLFLGKSNFAPARRMVELGVPVAIATDFNPGSSTNQSLFLSMSIACLAMRMTPAEAILGVTINGARAIGRERAVGHLSSGAQADILVLDVPDHLFLPYDLGGNRVSRVYKSGKSAYSSHRGIRGGSF
ncbi:MAG: imidazolonepropionase [Candidatus Wallbacteria bacterium HGW-Wallbacteria-1]|jgi:imidazolonepropionase|uniref:Imidazolonepropionase n=1 Tax=Candidatus Wallbacteria bacterium HGW-Wallbacteria-1 TaxID=2013854 RepID=A0A2N1PTG2_9BACT|nr:MAG: imidazolonepropionase [Candidatus Wallbacteria bacterium HGW-Wallbacteria-1]